MSCTVSYCTTIANLWNLYFTASIAIITYLIRIMEFVGDFDNIHFAKMFTKNKLTKLLNLLKFIKLVSNLQSIIILLLGF